MQIFKKFFVFILGLLFVFAVFEVFLRVFYFSDSLIFKTTQATKSSQVNSETNIKNYNILFLGNSHTEGAGVGQSFAYPAVLQNFFDQQLKGSNYKVNVFNGGMANANTTDIYNKIDQFVNETHPNLALIMAGEANIWNRVGYSEYAEIKNQLNESAFKRLLVDLSQYSKAIRWLTSLNNLTIKIELTNNQENELLVYKELEHLEKDLWYSPEKNQQKYRSLFSALNAYVEKNRSNPVKDNWRAVLYALARLEFFVYDKQESALDHLQESISYNSNIFDLTAYVFLIEITDNRLGYAEIIIRANQMLNQMRQQKSFLGNEKNQIIIDYAVKSLRTRSSYETDPEFIKQAIDIFPISLTPSLDLANYYMSVKKDFQTANQILLRAARANPLSTKTNLLDKIQEMANKPDPEPIGQIEARDYIQQFKNRFPSEQHLFEVSSDKVLYDWIYWGLEQIIDKFSRLKIQLVIQNYHWIRYRSDTDILYTASSDVAKNRQVPFIDTHAEFTSAIVTQTNDVESYFAQRFGKNDSHPSEKGHKLIAYIIYKNLVQQKLLPDELSHFDANLILE